MRSVWFLEDGRGVRAGNGGGRQEKYSCSGAPAVAKKIKPGDPPQVCVEPVVPRIYTVTEHTVQGCPYCSIKKLFENKNVELLRFFFFVTPLLRAVRKTLPTGSYRVASRGREAKARGLVPNWLSKHQELSRAPRTDQDYPYPLGAAATLVLQER